MRATDSGLIRLAKAQGKIPAGRVDSAIEAQFARDCRIAGLPAWKRNYVFLPGRKFECDFAYPEVRFGVEIEGMVHRIEGRFKRDIEKHALALLAGWMILRVDGDSIRQGRAVPWAAELLKRREEAFA